MKLFLLSVVFILTFCTTRSFAASHHSVDSKHKARLAHSTANKAVERDVPHHAVLLSKTRGHPKARGGKAQLKEAINRAQAKYQQSFKNYLANTGNVNKLQNTSFVHDIVRPRRSKTKRQQGVDSLTDIDGELLWTGPQAFGTPPQYFAGGQDFDTGSSDTFVNPGYYNPSKSSTARDTGKTFSVQYGDGTSASGKIYNDTLTVAGLQAFGQAVGDATSSDIGSESAGISGMAFPSIAQFQRDPFFYTLRKQGAVSRGVFGFGLSKENARLDLGTLDSDSYEGDINWVTIDDSNGFWQTSQGTLNGVPLLTSIIDTGTTVIVGAPDQVSLICLQAGGIVIAEGTDIFCGYVEGMAPPQFTFEFNGQQYMLSRDAIDFAQDGPLILTGIVGSGIGLLDGWVLGDAFLRNLYAAFDIDNIRAGFAPRR
ncbi:acid protease [Tilletiaria anomala UBC 951]|uniref:Acid protease n=1 Tax=Tilletiaria anomala (strain ATCC 24038 / CBS 436.72 / UBC 951) TaxID=1037660 RepID=A0A066WAE4_TILAU|nr:acid protease [Tilletiaria anomala UBC 951]KDN47745.1 acid protease [Tilletiaria anomala UBC 951]